MSGTRILVIDDDDAFRRFMRVVLTSEHYTVMEAASGEEALETLQRERSDVILLDLALSGMSGLDTCRAIRTLTDAAIILVSAHRLEPDKVEPLDAGADGYVTKPFSVPELLARIRAALRRVPLDERAPAVVHVGELDINFAERRVIRRGKELRLTRKEFSLLQYLVSNPDTTISHRRLLDAVWGPGYGSKLNYLRTLMNQLRKKIEPESRQPRYILTEHNVGYKFRTNATE